MQSALQRRLALYTIGAVLLAGCRFPASPKSPPDTTPLVERTVNVAGMERSYLLYVPEKSRNAPVVPVVLVFHGGLGRPENMPDVTRFNTLADTEGFVVAYPRGTSRVEGVELDTWNGGLCCGWAQANNVNDVGFIRALLDDLASVVAVDARRIFATGLSNGAIFSYRLACEMADRIAAIGPVSGNSERRRVPSLAAGFGDPFSWNSGPHGPARGRIRPRRKRFRLRPGCGFDRLLGADRPLSGKSGAGTDRPHPARGEFPVRIGNRGRVVHHRGRTARLAGRQPVRARRG